MLFWIISIALALAVAGLIALALMRSRADAEPPAAYDLRVYRDQLKEIDRDVARGVIDPADADRVRTEVSRRILAADAQVQAQASGADARGPGTMVLAAIVALILAGGAAFIYGGLGAPGYADLPRQFRIDQAEYTRQTRPDQAAAEAEMTPRPASEAPDPQFTELMEKLRATLAERPDDLQGHMLLAQNEASLGNFNAAWQAQDEVIRIRGDEATDQDFAELAEFMILAAGGYVSPRAEQALAQALRLNRSDPIARYYWGLMLGQIGRPDQAFSIWDRLLRESPADAPWVPAIESQIPDMAFLAGVEYQPRPPAAAAPGPSQADMAAAAEMTPQERQEMIRGMVEGLETRLAEDGGSPEEWARLIGALGVLGETERAGAALAAARAAFAGNADALTRVEGAASAAGVGQ